MKYSNQRPSLLFSKYVCLIPLKTILNHFIDFRHEIVVRRTTFELKEAEARAHILEGLKIALDNIDEIISIIRGSKNPTMAKEGLMNNFNLSEVQSQAILDMRLQKLTGLEVDKVVTEYKELLKLISHLKGILEINKEPLVSKDFNHNPHSSIFDLTQTQVIKGKFSRVLSWYDNEWGFSNRMCDTTIQIAGLI